MIYTSYFSQIRNFPENVYPLSISRFPPKWYTGPGVKNLAPSTNLLTSYISGKVTKEGYITRYTDEVLQHHVTAKWFENGIIGLFPNTDDNLPIWESKTNHIVLLCFEKPDEFCHRHLLAVHLENLGIPCREITKEELLLMKNLENLDQTRD